MLRVLPVLIILAAACEKLPTIEPRPDPVGFRATTDVWSGSEIIITSQGFLTATPSVLLDNQPIGIRRIDDSTIAADVPDHPGAHSLRVVAAGVENTAVTVQLRGFVSRVEGPVLSGRTEPGLDTRYLFGNGPTGLRRWNIRTNKAIELGDTLHAVSCTFGVGPGPTIGNLVLESSCNSGHWLAWHTEPLYPLADTASGMTMHFVAVLRPDRSIFARLQEFTIVACDASNCTTQSIPASGAVDVVRSPSGDRAALLSRTIGDSAAPGVPVVDVDAGNAAYRVRTLRSALGGTFSSGGEVLYLAGPVATGDGYAVTAMNASDGQSAVTRELSFAPCAVRLDQEGPWLYVAGIQLPSEKSVLQVFDRRTMTPLGTLHAATDIPFGHGLCRIMPNPVEHRVYVAETWGGEHSLAAHAQLYAFETPR